MKLWKCDVCTNPCYEFNNSDIKPSSCSHNGENTNWQLSQDYQITKNLYPVYIIDIKYNEIKTSQEVEIAYILRHHNGKKYPKAEDQDYWCGVTFALIPESWIKEVPPTTTTKEAEFQERLDNIVNYVARVNVNKVGDEHRKVIQLMAKGEI